MHFAFDKAVAFEATQRLGKHFLRNPSYFALERSVTHRAARKNLDDEGRPFVSNAIKHQPGGTTWIEHGRR